MQEALVLRAASTPPSLASGVQSTSLDAPACRLRGVFWGLFSVSVDGKPGNVCPHCHTPQNGPPWGDNARGGFKG